jgi:hypothetical protein
MKKLILPLVLGALSFTNLVSANINKITQKSVNEHIASWSKDSQKASDFMINKYGLPSGMTDDMLVWNDVKPFKKSIVYKEAITHKFPMEHKDVLEHFINYKAPSSDAVAKVWDFDGSVILERTKGEMSARCDKEGANILALNLADQVIKGERSVEEARMEYGRQIMAMKNKEPKKLTQKLVFTPAQEAAGDPGESIMDQLKKDQTKQAEEAKAE